MNFCIYYFSHQTVLETGNTTALAEGTKPQNIQKNGTLHKYMIRINWCIIAALLIYEIYTFYHLYQMLVHYNEFKDNASATVGTNAADVLYSSFGWMINLSVYIVLAFMAIVLFFSFLVCILLFILLPKLLFKNK
ncbi:MAG: hypothetical protein IPM95_10635 [Sphingobacteriales bacterium]|nr:hypothetical protein [Sphingobacteriales bacterium]